MKQIVMPNPPPDPVAGGGAQTGYEFEFNSNYMNTRDKRLWPFFNNRAGGPTSDAPELTQDERVDLANKLAKDKVPYDEQIDFGGEEPYGTMFRRKYLYNYTRVPVGQGTEGPVVPVNDADFVGPVVPGYLLVSVDINDFTKAE